MFQLLFYICILKMQGIATKPVAMAQRPILQKKEENESSHIHDPFSFSPPNEFKIKLYARMNLFHVLDKEENKKPVNNSYGVKG